MRNKIWRYSSKSNANAKLITQLIDSWEIFSLLTPSLEICFTFLYSILSVSFSPRCLFTKMTAKNARLNSVIEINGEFVCARTPPSPPPLGESVRRVYLTERCAGLSFEWFFNFAWNDFKIWRGCLVR